MGNLRACSLIVIVLLALSTPLSIHAQVKKLNVVASTTIIQDIAQNIAGDRANVDFLVPTDGDVHAFEPKPDDVRKIADADLILVNGVGLEQFLDKLITDSGTKGQVAVVSQGLGIQRFQSIEPLAAAPTPATEPVNVAGTLPGGIIGVSGSYQCGAPKAGEDIGECDPHLWQNVTNVIGYALNIRDALGAADPANADTYDANAGIYVAKLQKLDADIFQGLAKIPAANRVLVTNHDALGYFATRYGFQIAGVVLPGGATDQEPDPKQVAGLIQTVQTKKVKAIFLENVASDKLARQIADQAGVKVVQALYTDALGDKGTPGETYIGMMYANLRTLQDSLQ
jgi:zinc/manganese transport system substrate-binding protein